MAELEVGRYAIRTFKYTGSDSKYPDIMLRSLREGGAHWHDGVCVAECLAWKGHSAPADGCFCGIYGALDLQTLRRQYPAETAYVLAVIAVEGQTIIGTRGLRTQYARVVGYWSSGYFAAQSRACKRELKGARRFWTITGLLNAFQIPVTPIIDVGSDYESGAKFWTEGESS